MTAERTRGYSRTVIRLLPRVVAGLLLGLLARFLMAPVSQASHPRPDPRRLYGLLRVLLPAIASIILFLACQGNTLEGPAPDTHVVEGNAGWRLAVPEAPVARGDEVQIWFIGSELESGPRVDISLEVTAPDGNSVCCGNANIGAPGWTWLPLRHTGMAGRYDVAIRDIKTGEIFVEADFLVTE